MPDDFLERLRSDNETALSRLGSSKALYAATGGRLEAAPVLRAAAADAAGAAGAFASWAEDEPDGDAAATFSEVAERARTAADTLRGELDGGADDGGRADDAGGAGGEGPADDGGGSDPVADHLREVEGTTARAGALAGWAVVNDETLGQVVGFFVGDADPATAGTVREVRAETEEIRAAGLDLLDAVDDREAAAAAADAVVEAAYDDYVAALEGMGVDPKNVC